MTTPTDEQLAIIDAYRTGRNLVIEAGAGTGKTTTLKMLGADKRGRKGIYVAYNKAIAEDAKRSFPPDVQCATAHSFAYGAIGHKFRHRLNGPRIPARETARILAISEPLRLKEKILAPQQIARLVTETVNRFCRSADRMPAGFHVPRHPGLDDPESMAVLRDALPPLAVKAWEDLTGADGQLRFDHDVYLKMWQLSGPRLHADYILLDEAQDANPVIAAIVESQGRAQLIAVGDRCQAIYCQPVGTLVEVPVAPDEIPADRQCSFDPCTRQRDHITSGLCDLHEQQARDGLPLTPILWRRRQVQTHKVPIESLAVGDLVVTYDNAHLYRRGRPVTSVTRFAYSGQLVRVTTALGLSSSYTPKHHCVVRIGHELDDRHVIYLMRRGDCYRIGRVPVFYRSQSGMFGLGLRAGAERADAAWILSVHRSAKEAALAEALAQHQFNIPGVRFKPSMRDVMDVQAFWEEHGPNRDRAEECLTYYGRLIDFPLWESGQGNLIGVKRPFVTAAANLLDGFKMLPLANAYAYRGKRDLSAPASTWETICTERTWYEGDIVSLEVANHHTYFADGILTHNSWRGAVDAMAGFPADTRLPLSQSFRFGPAVACEANKWLGILKAELRLRGYDRINSAVAALGSPAAVLCRTNAKAMSEAMNAMDGGRKVAITGGGREILALAEAAITLKAGTGTGHPELFAFQTWGEVQDYAENDPGGSDLQVLVKLIDEHGPETIIAAVRGLTEERYASLVISTAHKAKGREWDTVRIAGDFREPKPDPDKPDEAPRIDPAEAMLAYVAVTRAKLMLDRSGLAWVDKHADADR